MERDQDLVPRLQTGIWGWWLCLPCLLLVTVLLYVGGKERGQPVATPIIPANQSKDLGAQVMAPAEFSFSSPKLGYAISKGGWFAEAKAAQQQLRTLPNQGPSLATGDWLGANPEPGQTFTEYLAGKPDRPTTQRHVIYLQPLASAASCWRPTEAKRGAEWDQVGLRILEKQCPRGAQDKSPNCPSGLAVPEDVPVRRGARTGAAALTSVESAIW